MSVYFGKLKNSYRILIGKSLKKRTRLNLCHTVFSEDLPYTNKPIIHEQGSAVLLDTVHISEILATLPPI
jgi:hypothetical protein